MSTNTINTPFEQLPDALRAPLAPVWAELQARMQSALHDKFSVIEDTLAGVLACSEFVTQLCQRQPHFLEELVTSGDLKRVYATNDLAASLASRIEAVTDEASLQSALRQFRQREMLRIIWRDLAGWADLRETLRDLSALADSCVQQALARLYQWQCTAFGTPANAQGEPQQLVVIAMGKLGAHELNLSSDIDLIFTFPEEGETRDGPRTLSNSEFFQKLGQKLITALSKQTSDGFVFRVDMRLRPFGDSGPLVCTFAAMEDYYQIHGREWERYALVKARVIAGDADSGAELLATLRPFVYRRYMDYSAYESLREMKAMIQKEVARLGKEQNVKVGAGGIREIEFIGQVFQLIRGGRERRLQTRSILDVLPLLQEVGLLPAFVVEQLLAAYDFLRRTENRLQAWRDQQTHVLPEDDTGRLRLAFSMGFADWPAYIKELDRHRRRVDNHFAQVFEAPQTDEVRTETGAAPAYQHLWEAGLEDAVLQSQLRALGLEPDEEIARKLVALREGRAYASLSARGRQRMDSLMPLLLGACLSTEQPGLALLRSLEVIEAIMRRTVYLVLLSENPMALSQLVRLCAASPWITRYLSQHPLVLDELLDPRTLYAPPDKAALAAELRQRLAQLDPADEEAAMDTLRQFKHAQFLRVAAADLVGALPLMKVSDHLSWIAEVVLEETLNLAWQHLVAKHGRPVCTADGTVCDTGFAVIAYGKLGGLELGYGSDLDLVFLHSGESESLETQGKKPIPLGVFFARLGQRMMHILGAFTPAGVLFEVDTRLRPDGAAGMLVSSLAAYEAYQTEKAWTWEHQALVRARVVAGDPMIAERFEAIRRRVLSHPRDLATVRREVLEMREKMRSSLDKSNAEQFDVKQGRGGIVDIEFMVQYGVLAHAHAHPALVDYTDNIRILERLAKAGVMTQEDAGFLSDTYRTYRDSTHRLKLQEQPTVVPAQQFAVQRDGVQRIWAAWLEGSGNS